jgi:lysophospholipid acyltransferase (LPLAT)-like uncharacterized protein
MNLSLFKRLQLLILPGLAARFLRVLASTWFIRELAPKGRSPKQVSMDERYIYAYWHEYIVSTVGHYRGSPIHALASRSFDGDLVARALVKLGYPEPARGSSSRGGAAGLKGLLRGLKEGRHVAVTVDGPRGPRRVAQSGVLKLAQLSGRAIVPLGFNSSSVLRLRSWDGSLIPLPFSTGVFCMGKPLVVPRGRVLDAASLRKLQNALDAATKRAESSLKRHRAGHAGDVRNFGNPQF